MKNLNKWIFINKLINHSCYISSYPWLFCYISFYSSLIHIVSKKNNMEIQKELQKQFQEFVVVFASKFHVISTRVSSTQLLSRSLCTWVRIWYDLRFSYTPLFAIEGYCLLRIQFELHNRWRKDNLSSNVLPPKKFIRLWLFLYPLKS